MLGGHLAKDARLLLRDWRGALVTLLLPVVILLVYAELQLADIAASGRSPDAFILVVATGFPALLLASDVLVDERRLGTLGRLARSPANLFLFVLSKLAVAAALLAAQVGVVLASGALLLPALQPVLGASWAALGGVLLLAGLASYALGLLVSAASGTGTQASQLAALLLLLMLVLAGFLQPLEEMPAAVAGFARALPVTLGYAGAAGVATGADAAGVASALLALLAAAFALGASFVVLLRAR